MLAWIRAFLVIRFFIPISYLWKILILKAKKGQICLVLIWIGIGNCVLRSVYHMLCFFRHVLKCIHCAATYTMKQLPSVSVVGLSSSCARQPHCLNEMNWSSPTIFIPPSHSDNLRILAQFMHFNGELEFSLMVQGFLVTAENIPVSFAVIRLGWNFKKWFQCTTIGRNISLDPCI